MNHAAFLNSYANELGTLCSLVRTGPQKIALWTHDFDEDAAADVFSVARIYPGPPVMDTAAVHELSVQIETTGRPFGAWAQAMALHNAHLDADAAPKRAWEITGYIIHAVRQLRPPGQVAMDAKRRVILTTNLNLAFSAA